MVMVKALVFSPEYNRIIEPSRVANELDVDCERKRSKSDVRIFWRMDFYLEIEFHLGIESQMFRDLY